MRKAAGSLPAADKSVWRLRAGGGCRLLAAVVSGCHTQRQTEPRPAPLSHTWPLRSWAVYLRRLLSGELVGGRPTSGTFLGAGGQARGRAAWVPTGPSLPFCLLRRTKVAKARKHPPSHFFQAQQKCLSCMHSFIIQPFIY